MQFFLALSTAVALVSAFASTAVALASPSANMTTDNGQPDEVDAKLGFDWRYDKWHDTLEFPYGSDNQCDEFTAGMTFGHQITVSTFAETYCALFPELDCCGESVSVQFGATESGVYLRSSRCRLVGETSGLAVCTAEGFKGQCHKFVSEDFKCVNIPDDVGYLATSAEQYRRHGPGDDRPLCFLYSTYDCEGEGREMVGDEGVSELGKLRDNLHSFKCSHPGPNF
ncbi:hypothetical protein FB451DRAFT_1439597 [Mycena latifolia]|nr:hypothetical protein FB451DRAFT_1439597 [Mycena latifolia]